jgi:hypothetical protein
MKGNLLAEEGNFLVSVMASVREILLKLGPSQFPPMRYRVCKLSCYMTIIQGTLLGEQSVFFGGISAFTGGILLNIHTSYPPAVRYERCVYANKSPASLHYVRRL